MSLQETSSLPPNNIIDQRAKGISIINGCSQRRLSQLTERAVDKALKLKAVPRRLVDVVDIQSCGEAEEFGCATKYALFTFAIRLFKNPTKIAIRAPLVRDWALHSRKPQDELIGSKIYSLLMRWRSDPTFEWRARVALAVPILEEALYSLANCREEEHISQQLLESYLERVLLHFEAGNGLSLLQGPESLHPLRRLTLESENSSYQTTDACEVSEKNASHSDTLVQGTNFAESSLAHNTPLEAMELDFSTSTVSTQMQVARNMPLKKRVAAGKARLECELAPYSEENIPNIGACQRNKGRAEIFSIDVRGEHKPIKHESIHHQNVVNARFSPRKTLGDMINLDLSNGQASRDPLVMPISSHFLTCGKNDATLIQETSPSVGKHPSPEGLPPLSSHSTAEVLPILGTSGRHPPPPTHALSALTAATPPLASLLTSSSSSEKPQSSSSGLSHVSLPQISAPLSSSLPLSPSLLPKSDPSPSSSSSVALAPFISSSSSSSLSQLPEPSLPSSLPLSSSLPMSTNASPSPPPFGSLSFMQEPLTLSSLPMMSEPASSSLPLSSLSPSCISPSVYTAPNDFSPLPHSTPLQAFAQENRPSLVSEEHHQLRGPWVSMYRQLMQMQALGCEIEAQASSSSATSSLSLISQPMMTETMDEASSGGGGREAVRLPLSIFLAERDECKMSTSIETWDEPTEKMDPLCCICMVGLKGAAFIPCGHTFCRKCSRELWRGRGACPLCNRFISEILDVY